MRTADNEIQLRQYLLGGLSPGERARIEDLYIADAEVFEALVSAENDLIDAYARGTIAEDDRRSFEALYLKSPELRERVEFARALSQLSSSVAVVDSAAARASFWRRLWAAFCVSRVVPQWALASAALVGIASVSWLIVQNRSMQLSFQRASAGVAELRVEEDALRLRLQEIEANSADRENGGKPGPSIARLDRPAGREVNLRLTPGTARGPGETRTDLAVPPDATRVGLQLMLDQSEYKTYEAILLTPEGKEIARGAALRIHSIDGNPAVAWSLPARSIQSGDYIVELTGRPAIGEPEEVDSYSFHVSRR